MDEIEDNTTESEWQRMWKAAHNLTDTTKTKIRKVAQELGLDTLPEDVKRLIEMVEERRKSEIGTPEKGRREEDRRKNNEMRLLEKIDKNTSETNQSWTDFWSGIGQMWGERKAKKK